MTIVVTGATGTVGRWCVAELRRLGHVVVPLSGPSHADGIDLLDVDAASRAICDLRPSRLVHLAWETTHGTFWSSPANQRWADASEALVAAAVRAGTTRVVVAGTCAEYDWRPEALGDGTCDERRTPIVPATEYGRAKAALHRRLEVLASEHAVRLAWGRVFWLYGEGEHPDRLVPTVTRALLRGEPVPLTDGGQVRDFLHARDVGAAFAHLVVSDVVGPVNVASGTGVSVAEVAAAVGQLVGAPELLRFGEVPSRDEPPRIVAAVTRLRQEVGFTPTLSLHEGLQDVVDSWRRRLAG